MRINLLIIMIVCITSSCGTDLPDQYVPIETLKIIISDASATTDINASDTLGKRQSIQDAISSELPKLTDPFSPIQIQRSNYSGSLLDPQKSEIEEKIYQLYFAEYLSEQTKMELRKNNLKDPSKYRLHTLLSAQNSATLSDLEHYLSQMRRFRFFAPQDTRFFAPPDIRFALVENFIRHTPTSQKGNLLAALQSIFSYLEEKKTDRYLIEAKAIPIIKSVFQLFKIPDIMDIDPASKLKDLFNKNHNLSLTVLQFEGMEKFCTFQQKEGKSMMECRDILNPLLLFLEPYLNQMGSLHFFSTTEIMLPIMGHFSLLMDNAHKDDIIFTVIRIFKHLEERRPWIINVQAIEHASSIIKLTANLFDIPNMKEFGLARLFTDLHYTNINIDMTVFLLEIVKDFVNTRYKEAQKVGETFDIYQCRNRLATVTQHMKQRYFFEGRIVNNKITREYCDELLEKLNVPQSSDIAMTLCSLFPQPIHNLFPSSDAGASSNTNDLGRDTPLPFALDYVIQEASPGLTAEQAIQIQRETLVARRMIVGDKPIPQALFSGKSAKPVYKSAPSLGLGIQMSNGHI